MPSDDEEAKYFEQDFLPRSIRREITLYFKNSNPKTTRNFCRNIKNKAKLWSLNFYLLVWTYKDGTQNFQRMLPPTVPSLMFLWLRGRMSFDVRKNSCKTIELHTKSTDITLTKLKVRYFTTVPGFFFLYPIKLLTWMTYLSCFENVKPIKGRWFPANAYK